MRICVFGAGAVGGHLAARLAASAGALGVDIARAPQRPSGGLVAPLAMARAARVSTPTLDAPIPPAAQKAAAKGLYKP